MTRTIGIDLGTTNSLCAVFEADGPRLIPNALGRELTPSVVAVLEDGRVLVGEPARDYGVTHPERVIGQFKRWMGTDKRVELGGRVFTAQELSSLVLRSLRDDAAAALGEAVSQAVITVPAYFNDLQREATKIAGRLAGLDVLRIVNEPTAAALAYGWADRDAEKRVVVFDLGGGTFDVTIMEAFEGAFEITASAGENRLGGEDFTARIANWVLRQHGLEGETVEFREPLRYARLLRECERGKRELTATDRCTIALPAADGSIDDRAAPRTTLTRETFEAETRDLVARMVRPVERAFADSGVAAEQVDEVVLVGGATRMPVIVSTVAERCGRAPSCVLDPDRVVALGAAMQAALIEDHAAVDDLVMTDVCPFTLGVEIMKELGPQRRAGYFMPLIQRNTTVPVSREEIVSTVHEGQTRVEVNVYQGEARKVAENLLLGTLSVEKIPPGPAGTPIAIRFTYDVNGLLEVEARIEATGEKFSTVFTHNVGNLSAAEIEAARSRLGTLKFYPREDLDQQQLLWFAEATIGEVGIYQREELENALTVFEAALYGNDRELFESARTGLLHCLSSVGRPFDGSAG